MLIEIPDKCYEVSWCLGWEIKTWDIQSIKYNKTMDYIETIWVKRGIYGNIFYQKDIGDSVFFDYEIAMQYLKEKENSGDVE